MFGQLIVRPVGRIIQMHPFGAGQIGRRFGAAVLGQHLESDVRDLERQTAHAPDNGEHLAADLVGIVVVAKGVIQRRAGQREAHLADPHAVHDQASTPTPMGQTTPVPPMPQYPAGFLAR